MQVSVVNFQFLLRQACFFTPMRLLVSLMVPPLKRKRGSRCKYVTMNIRYSGANSLAPRPVHLAENTCYKLERFELSQLCINLLPRLSLPPAFKTLLFFLHRIFILVYRYIRKAAVCCILVSHQKVSLKFMRACSCYHYTIIHQLQKNSVPGLARPHTL